MLDAHAFVDEWTPFSRLRHGRAAARSAHSRPVPSGLYVDEEPAALGSGAPIVMLHGLCGSARYWRQIVSALHAGPTLAVDLLGFGRSPWPECTYTPARHVDAIEDAILPRIGGADLHIVGHSTGADLALELAARHVGRVKSVTLLALPYFESEDHARAHLLRSTTARLVMSSPRTARVVCETMCVAMRKVGHLVLPLARIDVPRDVALDAFAHSFTSVYSTVHEVLVKHRVDRAAQVLERAAVPVTLLHDEHDPVIPFAGSAAYRARYANTRLAVVEKTGHLIGCSTAQQVAPIIAGAIRAAA
jgi:pimeloyl-ACP methyl ester carboxylesterase